MSISQKKPKDNIHLVNLIIESIRSAIHNKKNSLKERTHMCSVACKELLDFHSFHDFESFHEFVLALAPEIQEVYNILEKASSNAWFNPNKQLSKALVLSKKKPLKIKKPSNLVKTALVRKKPHKTINLTKTRKSTI